MPEWTFRPLSDRSDLDNPPWPSPYRVDFGQTVRLLTVELEAVKAERVVIEVDVTEREIRADGQLRAGVRAASRAARLAFDSMHGPLVYGTARFVRAYKGPQEDWKHNLRAVALGMEHLRALDRYGIASRNQQYAGYRAIEGGIPLGSGERSRPQLTVDQAARVLIELAKTDVQDTSEVLGDTDLQAYLMRKAAKLVHPDMPTGSEALMQQLTEARNVLSRHRG